MSLKSKIEAVIYASEEPVTLPQLVTLLSEEAQAELDALAARQTDLFVATAVEEQDPARELMTALGEQADATATAQEALADGSFIGSASNDATAQGPRPTDETSVSVTGEPTNEAVETEELSEQAAKRQARERERAVREYLRGIVDTLIRDYAESDRGLEIREVAGGFRFGTKPEYHDAVRGFVRNLKPALKLSLQALETLAVVAYKQPVTAAEISDIRGVDSAGVLGGLLTRKLIQTAGRKQVIGRPMLYKTSKEFLVRFGLRDVQELPSMEEFERMAGELAEQEDLPMEETGNVIERANARGDAEHIRETNATEEKSSPAAEAGDAPETKVEEDHRDDTPEAEDASVSANVKGNSSATAEAEPSSRQEPA